MLCGDDQLAPVTRSLMTNIDTMTVARVFARMGQQDQLKQLTNNSKAKKEEDLFNSFLVD